MLLLAGYAYAHWISSRWPAVHARIHSLLLFTGLIIMAALAFIWPSPIFPGAGWKPLSPEHPTLRILFLLGASVGFPFFLLSATAPLTQFWLTKARPGASPYWLYALSNLGSLLGLLSYPFLVEPYTRLHIQSWMWSAGFALFVLTCIASIVSIQGLPQLAQEGFAVASTQSVSRATKTLWFSLAALASIMLLSTTNVITQEVAVIPLLWVLPLGIYLLTFILCFESARWYRPKLFHMLFAIGCWQACYVLPRMAGFVPIKTQLIVFNAVLFVACMICNGELVRLKPPPERLTSFYLIISAGGVAGGIFVSLLAPLLFPTFWEYHIGLVGCGALLLITLWRDHGSWLRSGPPWLTGAALLLIAMLPRWWLSKELGSGVIYYLYYLAIITLTALVLKHVYRTLHGGKPLFSRAWLVAACIAALLIEAGYLATWARRQFALSIRSSRNFYGEFVVNDFQELGPQFRYHVMLHAQVRHGVQFLAPEYRRTPTAYYSVNSGVGDAMLYHPNRLRQSPQEQSLKIGIIGLGAGTIAAYGRPGDSIRYYEINPDVIRAAEGPNALFSFIADSQAKISIIPGDARLSLEREAQHDQLQAFDVLVIDAFNSDSIPVHLLTEQAVDLYMKHLAPGGLLAFHISNNSVDLTPVVMGLADRFHLEGARFSSGGRKPFVEGAQWVILSREKHFFEEPEVAARKDVDMSFRTVPLWTDDYSNLFLVLRNRSERAQRTIF